MSGITPTGNLLTSSATPPGPSTMNILAPLASGGIEVLAKYGVGKVMKGQKFNASLISKESLMEGGKQAGASFGSEQLQGWILSILPTNIATMIGNYTIPAGTGALKLAADMILNGELPQMSDAVVNFCLSMFSDVLARRMF